MADPFKKKFITKNLLKNLKIKKIYLIIVNNNKQIRFKKITFLNEYKYKQVWF